jgi:hypothetical protein
VFEVPAGHQVALHKASLEPGVTRTPGGVVLAQLGCAGDDSDRELDAIFRSLDELVRKDGPPTYLVNTDNPVTVADLLAPTQPPSTRLESPVLWIFHHGSWASLCSDWRRMKRVLERMHALKAQDVFQSVCVVAPLSRSHAEFVELVRDLGIELRHAEVSERSRVVLVEVLRPEGLTLSALAGIPAPSTSDDEELVPYRSPWIGRLVLELRDREGDTSEIVEALKARTFPLLLIGSPETGGVSLRQFGETVVIPAFTDLPALHRSALAIGLGADAYRVARMDARALFALAADRNVPVAICAFRGNTQVWGVVAALD